jgi:hypothetical protein
LSSCSRSPRQSPGGILYYGFAVFLIPIQRELAFSTTELTGAFSVALFVSGIAVGVALIVSVRATGAVIVGLVVLGMGNGMGTLARATAIADLYGAGSYGTVAAVTASMTTAARAAAPVVAALYAALIGYSGLLWTLAALAATAALLAWRAEQTAARTTTATT